MKSIRRKCNLIVDSLKFTFNKNISSEIVTIVNNQIWS